MIHTIYTVDVLLISCTFNILLFCDVPIIRNFSFFSFNDATKYVVVVSVTDFSRFENELLIKKNVQ
mgnify:CR=1 FL=1